MLMASNRLPKKQDLKSLVREWDLILAATGFKDIERTVGNDRVLIQFSSNAYRQADELTRESKIAYFDAICEKLNQTSFDNETDRYVMQKFSEGVRINQIVEELRSRGIGIHRQTCRYIIRRYETRWGIRTWSNKQMNLKKKIPTE